MIVRSACLFYVRDQFFRRVLRVGSLNHRGPGVSDPALGIVPRRILIGSDLAGAS